MLAALSEVGAFGAAETVAEALASIPPRWPDGSLGGLVQVALGYSRGDAEAGIRYLETHRPGVLADPVTAGIAISVAILYDRAGRVEDAIHVYESYLEAFPGDPFVANNLAYLLAESGQRLDEAERLVRQSLADDDELRPSAVDTLAWVLFRQGELDEAERYALMALRMLPAMSGFAPDDESSEELLGHLAEIRAALGQRTAEAAAEDTGSRGLRGRRGRRGR